MSEQDADPETTAELLAKYAAAMRQGAIVILENLIGSEGG